MRLGWIVLLALALPASAWGYVDYTPTLGRIVRESPQIALVEIEKMGAQGRGIIFRKVSDLRGQLDGPIKHQITDGEPPRQPREILDWAVPGARAVLFISRETCLVCIGRHWYQAHQGPDGWWPMIAQRPDLPLAYCGSVSRLAEAVKAMLDGQQPVITTLPHGANGVGACFDVAFGRTELPGSRGLQRIRAALMMPPMVCYVSANSGWFVGEGAAGIEDLPSLTAALASKDPTERIEALDDLATLGSQAHLAIPRIEPLLAGNDERTCLHAAAALLCISPAHARATAALRDALHAPSSSLRRLAAGCIGLAGPAAQPLVGDLIGSLSDPDADVRRATLVALSAMGDRAQSAVPRLAQLLDDPQMRCGAADALGQIGPKAQSAGAKLTALLDQDDLECKWAAVRALVQIGGPDAAKSVPFLIEQCDAAPRGRDLYNISVYLGLLGPAARPAIPALQRGLHRDRELCAMALWAIEPEQRFPWQWGYTADRDIDRWLFEAYIREMRGRAHPAATALAKAIVARRAGRMPSWGYQLLIDFPDPALQLLTKGLESDDAAVRRAVINALSEMGAAAVPAREALKNAEKSADWRTRILIQAALRQVGEEPPR